MQWARIGSFQQISERGKKIGEFSSFWWSFLLLAQKSLQTKDFPPPQMSSDTEFVISDNTHFHSNKQRWPKHRIMWLHLESSRILTRTLTANTFHFCGTSLQRISGSFTHIIPNLQMEKWRGKEIIDLFWDQEKRLGSENPGGRQKSGLQAAQGADKVLCSPAPESYFLWDNTSTWLLPISSLSSFWQVILEVKWHLKVQLPSVSMHGTGLTPS